MTEEVQEYHDEILKGLDSRPTVYEAWSRVMEEVQAVSKNSRNASQGFNFRGIDAVMNAVGPVLRKYGVIVVPTAIGDQVERYETAPRKEGQRGTPMVNRVVEVEFAVYGPRGDSFRGSAYGEAADSGDKAMAKAHSVAYRTFLLQALTIPTDEPDPDSESHERGPHVSVQQNVVALNTDNQAGRDELRALCEEKGWEDKVIAGIFVSKNPGQSLRTADNETIRAFISLLREGLVPVPS